MSWEVEQWSRMNLVGELASSKRRGLFSAVFDK